MQATGYVLKDAKGKERLTCDTLKEARSRLGHGWSIWYRSELTRTVETQVLHKRDKVSTVRNAVNGARIGGQHSVVLHHKVPTGRSVETRLF